jgi:hypothetical protein
MTSAFIVQSTLRSEVFVYNDLRERLIAEFTDLDEQTVCDTLEGITQLYELVAEVIRSALDDEALASGLSTRLSELKARLERFENRAKRKRELALSAMDEAQIQKITAPDFTASLKQGGPVLDLIGQDKIPAAYWKPQPPKLDKQGLLQALKSGTIIEGAAIAAPKVQLSVRVK